MSDDQNSGDKTENATPKRLRDARKKGDVAKGRDLTSTLSLAFYFALLWLTWRYCSERVVVLMDTIFASIGEDFEQTLPLIGSQAIDTFLILSAILVLPVVAFGLLLEYLQTGSVVALDKVIPKMSHLNMAEGLKRMFSMDSVFDLLKNIAKALILGGVAFLIVRSSMDWLVLLPANSTASVASGLSKLTIMLMGWTLAFFLFVTALDTAYRHHAFAKKMKMSMSDIRKEGKENEGDPMIKNQRRELHRELSEQSATGAASAASVLVVNPTHVAIAIQFNPDEAPVPIVTAKGEHHVARAMRDAANDNNVPVVRNERLARTLLADVDEGDVVPEGLFDIVAEIIFWAGRVVDRVETLRQHTGTGEPDIDPVPAAPGEDLTAYPHFASQTENATP